MKGAKNMKALKIWGWLLFASSVILYLIGLIGGEFNSNVGVFFLFGFLFPSFGNGDVCRSCDKRLKRQ